MAFTAENALEAALIKAADDPAYRPQFYRDFCAADIFFIQHGKEPPATAGQTTLEAGTSVQIQSIEYEGLPYIPIFTSLPRLQLVLSSEVAYMAMNAKAFMEMTQGANLALNPGSEYGKTFPCAEVAAILDGSIWQPQEHYTAEKDTQVMLGLPKEYPQELVQALSRYFATQKCVKRAWLAHFYNPEDGHPAHTLIAVEAATDDFARLSAETGIVINSVPIPNPPVDLIQITGNGGIEEHFLQGDEKPFYTRRRFLGLF